MEFLSTTQIPCGFLNERVAHPQVQYYNECEQKYAAHSDGKRRCRLKKPLQRADPRS